MWGKCDNYRHTEMLVVIVHVDLQLGTIIGNMAQLIAVYWSAVARHKL